MRAKTVEFERGRDPKDALSIGNERLRQFRRFVKDKKWFAPMQTMIDGLMEGAIPEKEAVDFVERAIVHYDTRKSLIWYKDFEETGNVFWNKQNDNLSIIFEMPEVDFLNITKYRKVYSEILRNESFIHDRTYQIHSWLKITQDDGEVEELFQQHNLFYPYDTSFKMSNVIHQINKVVEDTIKYTD